MIELPYLEDEPQTEIDFENKHKNVNCNYLVTVTDKKYSQVYYKIDTDKNETIHHENEKVFDEKFVKVNSRDELLKSV